MYNSSIYTYILHIHNDKWHIAYDFNVGMQWEILGPMATQSAHCQPKVNSQSPLMLADGCLWVWGGGGGGSVKFFKKYKNLNF